MQAVLAHEILLRSAMLAAPEAVIGDRPDRVVAVD